VSPAEGARPLPSGATSARPLRVDAGRPSSVDEALGLRSLVCRAQPGVDQSLRPPPSSTQRNCSLLSRWVHHPS